MLMVAGIANEKLVYDATIVADNADALADQLHALAKSNPAVARALRALLASSQWAGLVGIVVAIGVPIAANHGLLPPAVAVLAGAPMPPNGIPDPPTENG